jgi:hypothetical protein
VLELDDFLEQPHRRLMRQTIDQRHRGFIPDVLASTNAKPSAFRD